MKPRFFSIAVALFLFPCVCTAQVTSTTHAFDLSAPDANKYNLDMTQDVLPTENFMYCRWGTLSDQHVANGQFSLQFDYLTPPPFSQESRDLFILPVAGSTDQFLLSSFPNELALPSAPTSWTTPLGPYTSIRGDSITIQPGQVQLDSPQNGTTYFLFRKHEFSPVLLEFQGPRLDPNVSKLIIMIHGWNRGQNYDDYAQDTDFNNLGTAIKTQVAGTEWKLVGYHWETDADTGNAFFGSRPAWGPTSAAEAAEAGYLHGLHLGQVLLNNYPQLHKIHLIAHSAGAWCARTAAKYIMQRSPGIKVEVTLLDPFVPGAIDPTVYSFADAPTTSLTDDRIDELLNFGSSAYQLENYYSDDGAVIAGTQETFWGGGGVDWGSMAINLKVGNSVLFVATGPYGAHSGPIHFYSDTVSNTLPLVATPPLAAAPTPIPALTSYGATLQQIGWWRSMFMDETIIDQQPVSVTGATEGQPVTFTAHATTRREQRGYPASGLNLEYSWQKYDDASTTWVTAYGSSLLPTYQRSATSASDAGQYRVIADNGAGGATSQVFTLSFDTGSGSPISVSSPASGATVNGTVSVSATTSASVAKVKFYVDGVLKTTDSSAPFTWSWDSTQSLDSLHSLTANAYDTLGTLLGVSAPVTVTVNNGSGSTGSPDIYEPNDSSTQAALLGLSANIQAYISSPTDVDWFKVNVTGFGTLQLNLSVPAGKDFDLELYGPNGAWLAGSYNPAGYAESIQQIVTTPGIYCFRVYGYPLGAGDYSPSSAYTLSTSFAPQVSTITASGGVTTATWSGVVNLTGDVTIGAGSVLTILPGTVIQCQANTDTQAAGANPNRVEIILNGGTLHAIGTPGSPILFTSSAATKTPGDWYGIRVTAGDVTITNCVVEYAVDGIRFENSATLGNTYVLGNVTVQRCSNRGVYVTSGQSAQVTLNNFTLWTNSTGLQSDGGPVTLVGGMVTSNSGTGISCWPLMATGTTVSQNGGTGIALYNSASTLTGCVVTNNHGDGVYGQNASLQLNGCTAMNNSGQGINLSSGSLNAIGCSVMNNAGSGIGDNYGALRVTGCTLSRNGGWGVFGQNPQNEAPVAAEMWNNLVQSNGSGGLAVSYSMLAGVVSNTINGNSGAGLNLNLGWNGNGGVSASGITGNEIWGNGGVGVEVQGSQPSVLTISGNDIYQNSNFELRNDSTITITANNNYWGQPTTTEFNQGQVNFSRIYDSHDNSSSGQVLVQTIRTSTLQTLLQFVQQPQSVTPNLGDTVNLSPIVAGSAPIGYQWFDNDLPMPQATNLTLTLSGVTVANSGGYFLVISNASGVVTSSVAFVAVMLPPGAPSITQQPLSRSVLAGTTVSFAVVAGGTGPFGYQWQKDGVAINGAISPTFVIASVAVNDTGAYSVIVTNSAGSTPSQAATLTVNVLSGSAINRTIATNGGNFAVSLVVSPPAGTPAYMVEEVLPTGFTPNTISSSGAWDATSRTITWGPFWDGLARSLTYTLVPPNGFSGTASLTGQALLFGANATTGGDSTVQIGPPPMRPVLSVVNVAPGLFGVSVAGEVGRLYRIDAAEDLGAATWTPLVSISLTQSPFTFVDLGSATNAMRFYRITVLP